MKAALVSLLAAVTCRVASQLQQTEVQAITFADMKNDAPHVAKNDPLLNNKKDEPKLSKSSKLPFFYPSSRTFVPKDGTINQSLSIDENIGNIMDSSLGLKPHQFEIVNSFTDIYAVKHIYLDHIINNVSVQNHNAAIHIKDGIVVLITSSFSARDYRANEARVTTSLQTTETAAQITLDAQRDSASSYFKYVELPTGDVVYAYHFQVRNDRKSKWYLVSIDCHTGIIFN